MKFPRKVRGPDTTFDDLLMTQEESLKDFVDSLDDPDADDDSDGAEEVEIQTRLLSFAGTGDRNLLGMYPGLYAVISGTRGGKTTLMRQLATALEQSEGAVFGPYFVDEDEEGAARDFAELAEIVAPDLETYEHSISDDMTASRGKTSRFVPTLLIDGMRLKQFDVAGGTIRVGGMATAFLRVLTHGAILARRQNIVIVVTLNPLSGDKDAIERQLSDIRSSVSGTIEGDREQGWAIQHRREDREFRELELPKAPTPPLSPSEADHPPAITERRLSQWYNLPGAVDSGNNADVVLQNAMQF